MAAPGLGVVFVKKASIPAFKSVHRPRGYYLDVIAECERQASRSPAAVRPAGRAPRGAHAACEHLRTVGIAAHMARIQRQMATLIDHLAKLDIHPLLDEAYRSNIAVNFRLPVGLPYSTFSKQMEARGYFVLYGIPGDQSHFQLSTIGNLSDDHIMGAMAALSDVLRRAA